MVVPFKVAPYYYHKMFIIPFTHKIVTLPHINVNVCSILTIGGTTLWKEDDTLNIVEDILLPNGISLHGKPMKIKDVYVCHVDEERTQMNDFYKWSDISDNDTFCWKTFYTFGVEQHSWLPIPEEERLEPYPYQDIVNMIDVYRRS